MPTFRMQEKKGSVGILIPNTEGRIVDDSGRTTAIGQPGEVWIRSPAVMKWGMLSFITLKIRIEV